MQSQGLLFVCLRSGSYGKSESPTLLRSVHLWKTFVSVYLFTVGAAFPDSLCPLPSPRGLIQWGNRRQQHGHKAWLWLPGPDEVEIVWVKPSPCPLKAILHPQPPPVCAPAHTAHCPLPGACNRSGFACTLRASSQNFRATEKPFLAE